MSARVQLGMDSLQAAKREGSASILVVFEAKEC